MAQHRHHRGLGAPRCLRQSRLMLVMMGAIVLHTIDTSRALVRADASTSIGPCAFCLGALGSHKIVTSGALVGQSASSNLDTCSCFWGHLSRTPSAPTRPWCTRMPVPESAHALCCWGHLALTALTQKGFGVLRYLEWSRLMLVLLGAPFSHTIKALVRGDSSTSLYSIGANRALVRQIK